MTNLMWSPAETQGLAGPSLATQRSREARQERVAVRRGPSNFLMGRTFLDIDMMRAADLLGMERRQAEAFAISRRGHFIAGSALPCRAARSRFRIGDVETQGVGDLDLAQADARAAGEQPAEEARDLILRPAHGRGAAEHEREQVQRPARPRADARLDQRSPRPGAEGGSSGERHGPWAALEEPAHDPEGPRGPGG